MNDRFSRFRIESVTAGQTGQMNAGNSASKWSVVACRVRGIHDRHLAGTKDLERSIHGNSQPGIFVNSKPISNPLFRGRSSKSTQSPPVLAEVLIDNSVLKKAQTA